MGVGHWISVMPAAFFRRAMPALAISSGSQRLETQFRLARIVEYPRRPVGWKGLPRQEVSRVLRGTDGGATRWTMRRVRGCRMSRLVRAAQIFRHTAHASVRATGDE